MDDVKKTIKKLERLYKSKKYTHKKVAGRDDNESKIRSNVKTQNDLYPNAKDIKKHLI